jgi:hypothetical protein
VATSTIELTAPETVAGSETTQLFTPLAGLEVSFPRHGRAAPGMILVINQSPRATVLGWRRHVVVVLLEPLFEVRGAPDVKSATGFAAKDVRAVHKASW